MSHSRQDIVGCTVGRLEVICCHRDQQLTFSSLLFLLQPLQSPCNHDLCSSENSEASLSLTCFTQVGVQFFCQRGNDTVVIN